MTRETGDAWWEWQPDPDGPVSNRYDEEEMDWVEQRGDYALVGSVPLTIWDLMVLKTQRVSGLVDLDMEYLR
jgi:hypothetical protein